MPMLYKNLYYQSVSGIAQGWQVYTAMNNERTILDKLNLPHNRWLSMCCAINRTKWSHKLNVSVCRTELLPDIHDRGMVRDRASTMPSKRSRHQSEQLVNHSTSDITLLSPGSSCSSIGSKPASRRGSLQCDPKASRSNTRPEKVVTRSISGTNLFIRELHELRPLSRSRSYSDTFNRETDNNKTNSNKADSNKTDSRFSKVDLKKRYRTTKTQSTEETNVRDLVKSNLPTQKGIRIRYTLCLTPSHYRRLP